MFESSKNFKLIILSFTHQPPVEETDEHEDEEGPKEEQIVEPIEKVLPEEEHLVQSKGKVFFIM